MTATTTSTTKTAGRSVPAPPSVTALTDPAAEFIDGDPNWNPVKVRPGAARLAAAPKSAKSTKSARTVVEMKPGTSTTPLVGPSTSDSPSYGTIEWPIPVRPGVTGKLVLPDRMSQHEVAKVVKMVTALAQAVEEQLALPPGSPDS